MRRQYEDLRAQSLKELDEIQAKFNEERRVYIENSKKEVEECFKQHLNMEADFSKARKKN